MLAFVFTIPDWVSYVIATAALITAGTVIWKVITKFSRLIYLVETYGPVLITIGEQFKANGGKSLKDQIDRIEASSREAVKVSGEARTAAAKTSKDTLELVVRLDENVKLVRSLVVNPSLIVNPSLVVKPNLTVAPEILPSPPPIP